MLIQALQNQFSHAFDVLQAAIPSFSEAQWRDGSSPYNGPARATAHVLTCAEFYTSDNQDAHLRFGKKVWQMGCDELPSQESLLGYLTKTRNNTRAWVDSINCESEQASDPEIGSKVERIVYALRHLQHHIGEICAYQKAAGLEPSPWK